IPAIFGGNFRSEITKFSREKTRVMLDHNFWIRRNFRALVPIVQICDESLGRTTDVKEIHRVRPDTWQLWPFVFARATALRSRDDFPDRAAAKPARAKRECLVKSVVQFRPCSGGDEFIDNSQIKIRWRSGKQRSNVRRRRFHQFAVSNSAFDFRMQFFNVARHGSQLCGTHALCKRMYSRSGGCRST